MERPSPPARNWKSSVNLKGLSLTEVAAVVAEHLKAQEIELVVVGGSAITAHVPHVYTSQDIDFANPSGNSLRALAEAMKPIGFEKIDRVFVHPDTVYTVDFVADNRCSSNSRFRANQNGTRYGNGLLAGRRHRRPRRSILALV